MVSKDFKDGWTVHCQALFPDCKNEHPIIFPSARPAQLYETFKVDEELQPIGIYSRWNIYPLTSQEVDPVEEQIIRNRMMYVRTVRPEYEAANMKLSAIVRNQDKQVSAKM